MANREWLSLRFDNVQCLLSQVPYKHFLPLFGEARGFRHRLKSPYCGYCDDEGATVGALVYVFIKGQYPLDSSH